MERPTRIVVSMLLCCGLVSACGKDEKRPRAGDTAVDVTEVRGGEDAALPDGRSETGQRGADVVSDWHDRGAGFGGVAAADDNGTIELYNSKLILAYDTESGLLEVREVDGRLRIRNGESRIRIKGADMFSGQFFSSSEAAFAEWSAKPVTDPLGDGVEVTILRKGTGDAPSFEITYQLRKDSSYLLARVTAHFPPGSPFALAGVLELAPLAVIPEREGVFLVGEDPLKHLVVDNGADMYMDFAARVYRVGSGNSVFFPGRGGIANWNAGIYDSESKDAVVAGFLSFDRAIGLVATDYLSAEAVEVDGRKSFKRFEGFVRYEPRRLPDENQDGSSLASELFYLDLAPETIFDGLENWASRYATFHEKKLWTDIPSGWNSWGGGGGEGGLGANLDEKIILDNLAVMVEDFKPWGMKYFLLDDGWQVDHGDWDTHPGYFPDHDGMEGMAWISKQIQDQGLIPGIWIAPFWVKKSSQLYKDHPEWMAPTGELGGLLVGNNDAVLDLTNPEVLQFIHDTFHKITQVWGFKWIKMDFAYYALFAEELHENEKCAAEAFHDALNVIRDAIGPETFFTTISAMGLCMDTADGSRTTLDNMPTWGEGEDQGIKITLRTAAHRYYLNWLWSNHHDLVFYRPDIGLTLNEARAWTSAVSLMGGIMKLGEQYTVMHEHPDWLAMARNIIPVYPKSARPLDMFEMLHPEVWHLKAQQDGKNWDVVGLFNWGTNVNVLTGEEYPGEERTKNLSLEAMGHAADSTCLQVDSWDLTCKWLDGQDIEEMLAPRTDRILIVHCDPDDPMIAKTSRHLLGGIVEVTAEELAAAGDGTTLTATIDHPVGHPLEVLVYDGGKSSAKVNSPPGATIEQGPCNNVWSVKVTPETTPVQLSINFH